MDGKAIPGNEQWNDAKAFAHQDEMIGCPEAYFNATPHA
jgi:hypothetical protein